MNRRVIKIPNPAAGQPAVWRVTEPTAVWSIAYTIAALGGSPVSAVVEVVDSEGVALMCLVDGEAVLAGATRRVSFASEAGAAVSQDAAKSTVPLPDVILGAGVTLSITMDTPALSTVSDVRLVVEAVYGGDDDDDDDEE